MPPPHNLLQFRSRVLTGMVCAALWGQAISPMDSGRRCFRLVGGVLVERTVGEVLPAVERNRAGLQDIVQRIMEQREAKLKTEAEERSQALAELQALRDAPLAPADPAVPTVAATDIDLIHAKLYQCLVVLYFL